jgi:hypothetical protein
MCAAASDKRSAGRGFAICNKQPHDGSTAARNRQRIPSGLSMRGWSPSDGPPGIAAADLPVYLPARRAYSPAVSARMEPWLAPGGMAAGTGVQVSDAGESLVKAV